MVMAIDRPFLVALERDDLAGPEFLLAIGEALALRDESLAVPETGSGAGMSCGFPFNMLPRSVRARLRNKFARYTELSGYKMMGIIRL